MMFAKKPDDLQKLLIPVWDNQGFMYEESFFPLMRKGQTENDALCDELGERAALVPMTSMHRALLQKKRVYDMTGNNINHPNDFLARVYAQTILAQLL